VTAAPVDSDARVTPCKGGPLLVRGATEIEDAEGHRHPVDRPVVALCRCNRTDRAPWCDDSHKTPRRPSDS
jgi:CDGSH-type Zn-finger protein